MRLSKFSTELRETELRENDCGSASLEFITAGLVLLLPLVYLVLTMSSLQAGAFAVEGAARQAARVYVQAPSVAAANAAAGRAVEFALADYGLDASAVSVSVSCRPNPANCLTRRGFVTVVVTTTVPLPLVPPVLDLDVPLSVPVTSTATQQVSRFWGSR
jgi:hypothetical protein